MTQKLGGPTASSGAKCEEFHVAIRSAVPRGGRSLAAILDADPLRPRSLITKRGGYLIQARPVFWVLLGGALLVAATAIGAGLIIINSRDLALRGYQRELENTVLLLARHFDKQIEDFEAVQESLARDIDGRFESPAQLV